MSDGTAVGNDRHIANSGTMNDSSPFDLDGSYGTTDILALSATKTNLKNTLSTFNSKTPTADNLFIFTTGHGGNDTQYYNGINSSIYYLWGNNEIINDIEFNASLPYAPKNISIVMEQCNSGGFVDNIVTNYQGSQNRTIATAANGSEPSYGNFFSNAWMAGVARIEIGAVGTGADASPFDGRISMPEAFNFAKSKDDAAIDSGGVHEHPQYESKTANAGDTWYLSSCPSDSITVISPNGGEFWYKGYNRNITWKKSGLSGRNVVIQLWNKTPRQFAGTIATVAASSQTYKWYVNNTTWLKPGADYFINISTSDGTLVTDSSNSAFTIYSYNRTGYLMVNSTPIPNMSAIPNQSGAAIWLDGIKQPSSQLTNKSIPADPGTHLVSLTRSGFSDPGSQPAEVPPNGGTSRVPNFLMVAGQNSNDPNGEPLSPAGTLYVTATYQGTPVNARILLGGDDYTGWMTGNEIGLDPETYPISVKADGYQIPEEQMVPIRSGEKNSVAFTLKEIPKVPAEVQIVPKPLNIGRTGYFLAVVKLPTGYKAADVDAGSVNCENAKALKLVRIKLFPQIFVAIFSRQDLGTYPTGTSQMNVRGLVKKNDEYVPFLGSDTVTVINQKVTTKEDVDGVMTMPDTTIFTKFNRL
jgi:hypothetical protein